MTYYIYILHSISADKYYIGYSQNPEERLIQHNTKPQNTFTSKYRPWEISAIFSVGENKSEAISIERWLKKQKSKTLIKKLIDPNCELEGRLTQLVRVPFLRD